MYKEDKLWVCKSCNVGIMKELYSENGHQIVCKCTECDTTIVYDATYWVENTYGKNNKSNKKYKSQKEYWEDCSLFDFETYSDENK